MRPRMRVMPVSEIFDAVVVRQIPNDPDQPEVVFAAQAQNFIDNLRWRLAGRVFGNRFLNDQPGYAALIVGCSPAAEG